ncbi:cysteine desulfurase-like protein [Aquipuribacter nitratireducens]|uniref:Cysteine desulfurase-like protein n=1 Tax=Aquipuribacter nitratireducens TaxID=650104 RepID=A0ABW0GHN5_9MICO
MDELPTALDVAALRRHFPQLADGTAYFDGPGGTQTPDVVADAVHDALLAPLSNRGTHTVAARNADAITLAARDAVGDLLGTSADTVVFGRSATELTFQLARTLSRGWAPGDEVVVTRLDHDANVRPWVLAAEAVGALARWVPFDPMTGELDPADVAAVVGPRTRVVAVTGASNLIGTRPDLPAIAATAHEVGALLHVDGVHLAAHASVDVAATGADSFVCSPYKFLGPHCGVLTGRADLLESLRPDKLLPSSDAVPERFELGTLPYELLAGTTAAVDLLAGVVPSADATRRDRLVAGLSAVEAHEDRLRERIEAGLVDLGFTVWSRAKLRTPTLLCTSSAIQPTALMHALAERGVATTAGHMYAIETSCWLGLGDEGGLRIGTAPYTDDGDVDRLLDALADCHP